MANPNYYGLILAGGRGTRFWPRSRKRHAKQVLNVIGEKSLIQDTVARLAPLIPAHRIWILTNDYVRDEIVRQLPDVPASQIIAEPAQRNTAPAIGLAAHILRSLDPDAVFGVFPSDHVIGDAERYLSFARPAFRAAEQGAIAILGIKPRWPETGYGYIRFAKGTEPGSEPVPVEQFCEKPALPQAKQFVEDGNYYWNAGMFFWRAQTVLSALEKYQPRTAALLSSLPRFSAQDFNARLAEVFPQCDDISIDHGVMEKAEHVAGVPCGEFGWNDVGSWDAVYELLPRDQAGNVARSTLIATQSARNYVDCGDKVVALVDVDDLIVVDTPDALLITRRGSGQKVGDVVKSLEKSNRDDLL